MLRIHQANSSQKWRLMIKNAKMEKCDVTLSSYVQYVEHFKFKVNVARRPHRLPEKVIAKCFVNGLKPVKKCIQELSKNLDDVIRESRKELSTYRDILEISDRVKKSEPKKDFGKDKRD